jgi:uncharacterized membrane protein
MTEKQFLKKLAKALNRVSRRERKDILADYEEHFRAGRQAGKTDQEICDQLGDPVEIAQDFVDNEVDNSGVERPATTAAGHTLAAVLVTMLLILFNMIIVIGPFIGLVGGLIGCWCASLAPLCSSWILLTTSAETAQAAGLNSLSQYTAVAGMFAAGVFAIAMLVLFSRGFIWLTAKYVKFNVGLVRRVKGA